MSCNSAMQPGSKFNQRLLIQQQHQQEDFGLGSSGSDSLLFHKQMGYDVEFDMMLADAGYTVKSSNLAHVAQRLEQFESLCAAAQDGGLISHLSSETVHYNPSDMAGWIDSLIEARLATPGSEEGSSAVVDGVFHQQGPLHGPVEDIYGGFNTAMGFCSMDQSSTFDTRASYASTMPKQSLAMADMDIQPPTLEGCDPSISQLIKDAIGHHGVSTAASGNRYMAIKEHSSNMMMMDGDVRGYQQYKVMEDHEVSSNNQMSNFYGNQAQDMVFSTGFSGEIINVQGLHGLPKSNSIPSLQPQQPATMTVQQIPAATFQRQRTLQHTQAQVITHEHHDLNPTSSQSSNGRVASQESQHGPHLQGRQQVVQAKPQEINVKVKCISSPSTMSSSSPKVPATQEQSKATSETEASYVDAQHKLPHGHMDAIEDGVQEPGIRLVHLLMACAEAIQNSELAAAVDMVREIKRLASSSSGAMAKVANQFVEALARRIYGANIEDWASLSQADPLSELLYSNFYEACPYLKFAHFTANQAILEACEGHKVVHVIDFNLMQGLQWPALIQALALRPGGPPHLRMTGIGPPQLDNKDVLQEIGMKLAQLASSVNVEFSFRGVVATKLDDVKPWMLEVKEGEAIAVNSILQLHRLLYGANPKSGLASIDEVLTSIKSLSPKIITIVEQEANHNNPVFLERFVEALHYYCTMFDSLEACFLHPQCSEMACTEMYLGREIVNVVACEGMARVERHEPLSQWRQRMANAGFRPLHLGSNAFKQASMLLKLFSGDGYTVEENKGCLTLGWHSRPLIAASAWQCS